MEKLFIVVVLALAANGVFSRPQSTDQELDDRYGQIVRDEQGNFFFQQPLTNFQPNWQNRPNNPNRPIRPTTSTVAPGPSTTSATLRVCLQSCPVTPEYNPVCGTDNVLYPNPGRLQCAIDCGVNVSYLRAAPCPPSTPAPAS